MCYTVYIKRGGVWYGRNSAKINIVKRKNIWRTRKGIYLDSLSCFNLNSNSTISHTESLNAGSTLPFLSIFPLAISLSAVESNISYLLSLTSEPVLIKKEAGFPEMVDNLSIIDKLPPLFLPISKSLRLLLLIPSLLANSSWLSPSSFLIFLIFSPPISIFYYF